MNKKLEYWSCIQFRKDTLLCILKALESNEWTKSWNEEVVFNLEKTLFHVYFMKTILHPPKLKSIILISYCNFKLHKKQIKTTWSENMTGLAWCYYAWNKNSVLYEQAVFHYFLCTICYNYFLKTHLCKNKQYSLKIRRLFYYF